MQFLNTEKSEEAFRIFFWECTGYSIYFSKNVMSRNGFMKRNAGLVSNPTVSNLRSGSRPTDMHAICTKQYGGPENSLKPQSFPNKGIRLFSLSLSFSLRKNELASGDAIFRNLK
jgi:hypothetical protein